MNLDISVHLVPPNQSYGFAHLVISARQAHQVPWLTHVMRISTTLTLTLSTIPAALHAQNVSIAHKVAKNHTCVDLESTVEQQIQLSKTVLQELSLHKKDNLTILLV